MDGCRHCSWSKLEHQDEHEGLCCDCYDMSWGMPLSSVNEERRRDGKPEITKPYPGLDAEGNKVELEILA